MPPDVLSNTILPAAIGFAAEGKVSVQADLNIMSCSE